MNARASASGGYARDIRMGFANKTQIGWGSSFATPISSTTISDYHISINSTDDRYTVRTGKTPPGDVGFTPYTIEELSNYAYYINNTDLNASEGIDVFYAYVYINNINVNGFARTSNLYRL